MATVSVLEPPATVFDESRTLLLEELVQSASLLDSDEVHQAMQAIAGANRIFTYGAGRSGLALRMAAMRLMHLGLQVHVAGEVTVPAIDEGDLLIAASASGSTGSVVQAAAIAQKVGAQILAITAQPDSKLAGFASHTICVQAGTKQELTAVGSQQYAGSLFEQTVLLLFDALFHSLWQANPQSREELWKRHANLE
jgi:6-phospho-3-hexuloisomerase